MSNRYRRPTSFISFACAAVVASVASAEVRLHALFTDHMVVQRDRDEVPIWGTATPDTEVTVEVTARSGDGQLTRGATVRADANGKFSVPMARFDVANNPYTIRVTGDGSDLTLTDVLAGDVWVGSGQSNMQWSVKGSANPDAEIAAANHPNIRLFSVPRVGKAEPVADIQTQPWAAVTPESVAEFSAVAYYFGRRLNQDLNIPIGLIHTSWGGTPAEAWTPLPKLEELANDGLPEVKRMIERRRETVSGATTQPMQLDHPNAPASLYNGMIHPLGQFGIKGAIWYQGESNAGRAGEYERLLSTMIGSWREQFGQGDFPFYIVGLANFMDPTDDPNKPSGWAMLREAQRATAENVPNSGMSVTIDIGEAKDIHPRNKQDVGERLARIALAETYDKDIVSRGPTLDRAEFEDDKVVLHFDNVGSGLKAKGEKLESFAIAGEDGRFAWADAKIEGKTVVLTANGITKPTQAKYAFADNPTASLFNAEGLPAEPFIVKE